MATSPPTCCRTFARDDQVAFATPMRTGVRELVVTGPAAPPLVSLEDVGGRAIHVRRNSDHHASLRAPQRSAEEDRSTAGADRARRRVDRPTRTCWSGSTPEKIPATLVDDYVYDTWKSTFAKTSVNRDVAVSQDGELAWVTRKESATLLELINEFFATHRLTF